MLPRILRHTFPLVVVLSAPLADRRLARFAAQGALVVALLAAAACGDEGSPATGGADAGPDSQATACGLLDDALRIHQIQMLGTHNSYHQIPESTIPDFQYEHSPLVTQLNDEGVRSFELDLHHLGTDRPIEVHHIPGIDDKTSCATLGECLTQIKGWSDQHLCHHPIVILFEQKDELNLSAVADHWDQFEQEVLAVWPRERLVTPDDLRGQAASLKEAVAAGQWPTLGASRGKLLLVVYDKDGSGAKYKTLHPQLKGALAFVFGEPDDPDTAVVKRDGPAEADIDALAKAGYLLRTSPDADNAEIQQALAKGAHVVSTDNPVKKPRNPGLQVQLPGGKPSRCNPITAPANCTAEAVNAGVGSEVSGGLILP